MAATMISDQATKNNQRLFKRYAQIFQKPDAVPFEGHAQKFSVWLSDHKAYYVAARPEIIKLLLVAQGTLRRALHISEDLAVPFNVYDYPHHPLIPSYVLLVESILPYENMFMEPSLIAHIHTLRDTITPRHMNVNGPSHPQSSCAASLSPSGDSQSATMVGNYSPSTSATPFDPDIQVIEHRTQPPVMDSVPFSDPDVQIIERGAQPPTIANGPPFSDPDIQIIENPNQPLSAPSAPLPIPPQTSSTPPVNATAPVRRVKKRKTLNLEALARTDVQSLLPKKQTTIQAPEDVTMSINPSTSRSSPSTSSVLQKKIGPEQATVTANAPTQSFPHPEPYIAKKSDVAVADAKPTVLYQSVALVNALNEISRPSDIPPSADAHVLEIPIKVEAPSSPKMPMGVGYSQVADSWKQGVDQDNNQPMDVDIPPEPEVINEPTHPETAQDPNSILVEREVQHSPKNVVMSDIMPSIIEFGNLPTRVAGGQHQTQELTVPQIDLQAPTETPKDALRVNDNAPQPTDMDMDMSTSEPADQPPAPPQHAGVSTIEMDTTPPAAENQMHVPLQPLAIASDIEMDTSLLEPKNQAAPPAQAIHIGKTPSTTMTSPSLPASVSMGPTVPVQRSLQEKTVEDTTLSHPSNTSIAQPTDSQVYEGVFTSEMRVAAIQKGMKERRRIHFQFDIPEAQFNLVLTWLGRSKTDSLQEIKSSICLSLGCYLTADLVELSKKDDCDTIEKQVSLAQSVWPSGGNLVMNVQLEGTRQDLPLAPPLQVTPDNLVDISMFLNMGKNRVELSQYEDLSQYTFVLHAHYPTRAQLNHWEGQCQKDKEWKDWIQYMSRPLTVKHSREAALV